ncbi:MAG: hypothetical protein KAR05_09690 [Candidatus Omnitrophica bacterium]|nr:hypothetical protein [Candidatus Omnitrophota bacterium]
MGSTALIFILIFYAIMLIPCIGVTIIGKNLINKIGQYPSRTPALQLGVLLKLVILEVVSFTMLMVFFKALIAT